jgi:uncharacterized protein (TIGR02145 family)
MAKGYSYFIKSLLLSAILLVQFVLFSCDKYDLIRTNPLDPIIKKINTADLAVSNVSFSPLTINVAVNPTAVSFRLTNNGPDSLVPPNTAVVGQFYVSMNDIFGDGDDMQIGINGYDFTIPPNSYKDVNLSTKGLSYLTIPKGASGISYFFVHVQYGTASVLTDPNPSNDYAMYPGTIYISDSTVTDIDGNVYNCVTIGTQFWMAANLKTTKYNDGTSIPIITDNVTWAGLTSPAYCWYNNDPTTYKDVYGALYNWYAIDVASNSGKNVCPTGWHVPSDNEWHTLALYLDVNAVLSDPESLIAGGKLKETGTTHWLSPNTEATNESGFTALPGGFRYTGAFDLIGLNGYWWSSLEFDARTAQSRGLNSNSSYFSRFPYGSDKQDGFSIRCLKD